MNKLRAIWRRWRKPQGAVWLPVLPPAGALVELGALIALIQLADALFPGLDVARLEPSPYWLAILLLSLQYGTVAGLLAAGAATLAYVVSGLPEQVIDEHHFSYLLRVWSLPILWISVALILGQFRLRQIERKQVLRTHLAQKTREAEGLSQYVRELEGHCDQLERQLACAGVGDAVRLLDLAAAVYENAGDRLGHLRPLFSVAFPRASVTLYAVHASGLEPAYTNSERQETASRLTSEHPLYRAVVQERRAVSILSADREAVLSGIGLAAAPVHSDNGRVAGVVVIQEADSVVLTDGIENRLAAVARILAPVFSEPRVVVDNTEKPAASQDTGLRKERGRRRFPWQADERENEPGSGGGLRPRVLK